jgi:8-oxo-dGTP pyrophosphatase MutT (NUDIX family)
MRKRSTETDLLNWTSGSANKDAIDLDRLRSVLYPLPSRTVFVLEDGVGEEELTPASVLFPIVLREGGPSVLFTQRAEHLKNHPGQISFPGGHVESEDSSPAHTALREAREEIGLSSEHVEILGYLPEYRTGTGFRVTPVVAIVTPPIDLCPDPSEVAEIFEVPLAFLMDSANHRQYSMPYRGKPRNYFAVPYEKYFIWGATAGIVVMLSRALAS